MLTVSVLMVSITFPASHATPKKQCVSAQPNLCLIGTAGVCPSNGIQMPWCMASKYVMIQTICPHLSHSALSENSSDYVSCVALVHGKQICHDTDHLPSLVTLCLV
jgi:hypothetical protein